MFLLEVLSKPVNMFFFFLHRKISVFRQRVNDNIHKLFHRSFLGEVGYQVIQKDMFGKVDVILMIPAYERNYESSQAEIRRCKIAFGF